MNIYDVIRRETAAHLENTAVVDRDRQVSYQELFCAVDETARQLSACGVRPGQRIALSCTDSLEYIAVSLAVLSLGAALVPVSPAHSGEELTAVLAEIDVSLLISDAATPRPGPVDPVLPMSAFEKELFLHARDVGRDPPEAYHALNPAFIRFSSGTTGASKGVVLSHESIVDRTDAADEVFKVTGSDRVMWVLSMSFHFVVTILLFLRRGATIVLCGHEFPSSLVDELVGGRGTFLYASPFHYRIVTRSSMFPRDAFANVRLAVSTAVRLPESDAQEFFDKFGFELSEAYGIIEVGLPFVNCSGDRAKRGSVGRILPDYEVRLDKADDEGVGEVCLRGKGMFDAYFSPWRARDDALLDGWFRTGDLGRIDSDGFLFLAGRRNDVINFAGMKVFPEEVESVLNQHPGIRESLVYAEAHEQYGELPCAEVVLRAGRRVPDPDSSELRRFCYRRLAPYKVPKEFRRVSHLEKTASGKLKRWKRRTET